MTPPFLTAPRLAARHGFFTREGGVSEGGFASLNGSLSGHDPRDRVLENRARAARALGIGPAMLVGVSQVHGTDVAWVERAWAPGDGPRADAMATDRPGMGLAIVTADCAPVLLADAAAGVIGAAHAGWRGAVAGVLEATVARMQAAGAVAARIVAAIGPCIGQASYEVGAEMREAALAARPADAAWFKPGGRPEKWLFDLAGCCRARLEAAGVGTVDDLGLDTFADPARFYSHRRRTLAGEGPIGHLLSIVALPGAVA